MRGAGAGRPRSRAQRELERAQQLQAVRPDHAAGLRRREDARWRRPRRPRRRGAGPDRAPPRRASRSRRSRAPIGRRGRAAAASTSATASRTWAATRRCSASSTTALLDLTVSVPSSRLAGVEVGQAHRVHDRRAARAARSRAR
ncbi:MAG: hypothetical protein MZW92_22175 [Comamonadaceae bacterium]|nr:hypothetical protein [Comamonadaceae bacterium]